MCKDAKNFVRLECKHEFHFSCIFELMSTNSNYNNNCPMCRNKIVDADRLKVRNQSDRLEFQEMWGLIRRFETRNQELWWQSTIYFWTTLIMVMFFLGMSMWFYMYSPKTSIFLTQDKKMFMMTVLDEYILFISNALLSLMYHLLLPFYYIAYYGYYMIFNQYVISTFVLGIFTFLSASYGPVMNR